MANSERASGATDLLGLITEDTKFFHTADNTPYATIPVNGHRETCPVNSPHFKQWLRGYFYECRGNALSAYAIEDALEQISAKAQFDGEERSVFNRIAASGENIYLDLGDSTWRAVEVTPSGWSIVSDPPIRFTRSNGMMALPTPVPRGQVSDLRPFVNVKEDEWVLVLSWLMAALRPIGPYPVLGLYGEQGSAKSTTTRVLRELVDPFKAPIRALPQSERDLMVSASNSHVLAFDNISYLSKDVSDALCRLSKDGGFAIRKNYSDGEEIIFEAQRPILLNGIEEVATRGDLLDRMVILHLPAIQENARKEEAVFWKEFEAAKPRIVGALLNGVSAALRNRNAVKLANKPRMADFAIWASAAEAELGFKEGAFISAYTKNRTEASDFALESSAVGTALLEFMRKRPMWEGTATDLISQAHLPVASPRALSSALDRIQPALRNAGITFQRRREPGTGKRLIKFEKHPAIPSQLSRPSHIESDQRLLRDGSGDDGGSTISPKGTSNSASPLR